MPTRKQRLLSLLVVCSLGAGIVETAHAQAVAAKDSLALIAIYNATNGPEWFHWNGFGTDDQPVPNWGTRDPVGVENGRVVSVRLFSNNLSGTLPDEICDLDALRELNLVNNPLMGSIPECIGNMAALTRLEIWAQTEMTGSLPDSLGQLENLQVLNLRSNELTGSIPASLAALTNLKELNLNRNKLTGSIPTLEMDDWANLEELNLSQNQLDGSIPGSLGFLENLRELDLTVNELMGSIPADLGKLTNLETLFLFRNQLDGTIPAALGDLISLKELHLESNALTDFESGSYSGWAGLEVFAVRNNQLTNLPDLSGLSSLGAISVQYNKLTFADLEPLAGFGGTFTYAPQQLDIIRTQQKTEDGNIVLFVEEDGERTTYQWHTYDPVTGVRTPISGATDTTYTPTEEAIYACTLTNPRLPELTLHSNVVRVEDFCPAGKTEAGCGFFVNVSDDIGFEQNEDGVLVKPDGEPIDGTCDIDVEAEDEQCSLRAALQLTNANFGKTTQDAPIIGFGIPGDAVIQLGAALPEITQPVFIDGTIQSGGFVVLMGEGKSFDGLRIQEGGSSSTIQGLNLSNFKVGVNIQGGGENTISSSVLTENSIAILIEGGSNNTVEDNVIAGNDGTGVAVFGLTDNLSVKTLDNKITNNRIGTNAAGSAPNGNGLDGIALGDASRTTITGNTISANTQYGIHIFNLEEDKAQIRPSENTIEDNKIGTDITGTHGLPNCIGIRGEGTASLSIRNNTISANVGTSCRGLQAAGVSITRSENVTITGNVIGTDESGTIPLPNAAGIRVGASVSSSTIQDNVISSNINEGLSVERGISPTSIIANKIGTDISGTLPLGNGGHGIVFSESTIEHIAQNNVISANGLSGVFIKDTEDGGATLEGNDIGTALGGVCVLVNGACPLGNVEHGVEIERGKNVKLKGNVISGNTRNGVFISSGAQVIDIENNKIGTDADGMVPLGNGVHGIGIDVAQQVSITQNVISANQGSGLFITGKEIAVNGNKVGTDANGADILGVMGNRGHGVVLDRTDQSTVILRNDIAYNHEAGVLLNGTLKGSIRRNTIRRNIIGVQVIGGTGQYILLNVIERNVERGIDAANGVRDLLIRNNTVRQNGGVGTGIHLTDAYAIIEGNTITEDAGDAITLEQSSAATVTNNNIFGNAGMGLNNLSPSVMITASDNWWGNASGPSGQGPGSGDAVSDGINFSGWLDEMVAVVASAEADEVLLSIGEPVSVSVFLQNWQVPDDNLDLAISDTQGWLQSPTSLTVTLADSTGAEALLAVAVPAGAPNGTTSTVEVIATSQTDDSHRATTTFTLIAESAALAQVLVVPGKIEVAPTDTVHFSALGFDQFSRSVAITPTWTATGGQIDADGVYIAGSTAGEFAVIATDPATGLSGTARVGNGVAVAVEDEDDVPDDFHLAQNYPNPFNPETTIAFTLPQQAYVRLAIYDVLGREVVVLVNDALPAGAHQARFEASPLSSGVYFYHLTADHFSQTRTMVLLR